MLECLDEPENDEAYQLDDCEEMDSGERNLSQIWVVWLILLGHEEQEESVKELETIQRVDAHVEEDTIEDWHGDPLEDRREESRETNQDEYYNVGDSLLSGAKELNLLSWSRTF